MVGILFVVVTLSDVWQALFGKKEQAYDPYNDPEWDTWTTYTESSTESYSTCLDDFETD